MPLRRPVLRIVFSTAEQSVYVRMVYEAGDSRLPIGGSRLMTNARLLSTISPSVRDQRQSPMLRHGPIIDVPMQLQHDNMLESMWGYL